VATRLASNMVMCIPLKFYVCGHKLVKVELSVGDIVRDFSFVAIQESVNSQTVMFDHLPDRLIICAIQLLTPNNLGRRT